MICSNVTRKASGTQQNFKRCLYGDIMKCENLGYYEAFEKACRWAELAGGGSEASACMAIGALDALYICIKSDLNLSEDTRVGLLDMVAHKIFPLIIADDESED